MVGAILSGVVATLVALAAGGPTDALIVGAVAVFVQQLDNDLLAPVIYGRSLSLHPVVILLAVTAATLLFGVAGAVVAVPVVAVASDRRPAPHPADRSPTPRRAQKRPRC